MEISVCITVLNEERTISDLIMALLTQTKKPNEIVIVDGGSKDSTVSIIKHYQKKTKNIQLAIKKTSRARGRNIAVGLATSEIIAVTDAGCIPREDWLEKITKPFAKPKVEVVAGFYDMETDTPFQKALSVFLGVSPKNFGSKYLPSARSLAFRKLTFEKLSGFPELMADTAEDSLFAVNLVRQGVEITLAKNARVEWAIPKSFKEASGKFYYYALGDARSRIWFHPVTGLWSHNVKALLILVRYAGSLVLLFSGNPLALVILGVLVILYLSRAFRKVYRPFGDIKAGMWGITLQIASDLQVIRGLLTGLLSR